MEKRGLALKPDDNSWYILPGSKGEAVVEETPGEGWRGKLWTRLIFRISRPWAAMTLGHPHMDLGCFRYNCCISLTKPVCESESEEECDPCKQMACESVASPCAWRPCLVPTAKWYLDVNRQVTALLPCSMPCLLYSAVSSTPRPSLTQLLQLFPFLTVRSQLKPWIRHCSLSGKQSFPVLCHSLPAVAGLCPGYSSVG